MGDKDVSSPMFDTDDERRPQGMRPSPFFKDPNDIIGQSNLTFAFINQFPVVEGHAMILPNDPVYDGFALAKNEIGEHHDWLRVLHPRTNKTYFPDGLTIGWNYLFDGGQSIAHSHLHWMPRYHAVNKAFGINPRGGIAKLPFKSGLPSFYDVASPDDNAIIKAIKNEGDMVAENDLAVAVKLPDEFAATRGHSLIFAKRDGVAHIISAGREDMIAQLELVHRIYDALAIGDSPVTGANFGWDIGAAAGQIGHEMYMHFLPRRKGDVDSPRGGLLKSIPDEAHPLKTDYYDMKNVGKDVVATGSVPFRFKMDKGEGRKVDIDLEAKIKSPSNADVESASAKIIEFINTTALNGCHKLQTIWALTILAEMDPLYVSLEHGKATIPVGAVNIEFAKIQAGFAQAELAQTRINGRTSDPCLKARFDRAGEVLSTLHIAAHDACFDGEDAKQLTRVLTLSQKSLTQNPLRRMPDIVEFVRELTDPDSGDTIETAESQAYLNQFNSDDERLTISHHFMAKGGYVEMPVENWLALKHHANTIREALLDRMESFDAGVNHVISNKRRERLETVLSMAA